MASLNQLKKIKLPDKMDRRGRAARMDLTNYWPAVQQKPERVEDAHLYVSVKRSKLRGPFSLENIENGEHLFCKVSEWH